MKGKRSSLTTQDELFTSQTDNVTGEQDQLAILTDASTRLDDPFTSHGKKSSRRKDTLTREQDQNMNEKDSFTNRTDKITSPMDKFTKVDDPFTDTYTGDEDLRSNQILQCPKCEGRFSKLACHFEKHHNFKRKKAWLRQSKIARIHHCLVEHGGQHVILPCKKCNTWVCRLDLHFSRIHGILADEERIKSLENKYWGRKDTPKIPDSTKHKSSPQVNNKTSVKTSSDSNYHVAKSPCKDSNEFRTNRKSSTESRFSHTSTLSDSNTSSSLGTFQTFSLTNSFETSYPEQIIDAEPSRIPVFSDISRPNSPCSSSTFEPCFIAEVDSERTLFISAFKAPSNDQTPVLPEEQQSHLSNAIIENDQYPSNIDNGRNHDFENLSSVSHEDCNVHQTKDFFLLKNVNEDSSIPHDKFFTSGDQSSEGDTQQVEQEISEDTTECRKLDNNLMVLKNAEFPSEQSDINSDYCRNFVLKDTEMLGDTTNRRVHPGRDSLTKTTSKLPISGIDNGILNTTESYINDYDDISEYSASDKEVEMESNSNGDLDCDISEDHASSISSSKPCSRDPSMSSSRKRKISDQRSSQVSPFETITETFQPSKHNIKIENSDSRPVSPVIKLEPKLSSLCSEPQFIKEPAEPGLAYILEMIRTKTSIPPEDRNNQLEPLAPKPPLMAVSVPQQSIIGPQNNNTYDRENNLVDSNTSFERSNIDFLLAKKNTNVAYLNHEMSPDEIDNAMQHCSPEEPSDDLMQIQTADVQNNTDTMNVKDPLRYPSVLCQDSDKSSVDTNSNNKSISQIQSKFDAMQREMQNLANEVNFLKRNATTQKGTDISQEKYNNFDYHANHTKNQSGRISSTPDQSVFSSTASNQSGYSSAVSTQSAFSSTASNQPGFSSTVSTQSAFSSLSSINQSKGVELLSRKKYFARRTKTSTRSNINHSSFPPHGNQTATKKYKKSMFSIDPPSGIITDDYGCSAFNKNELKVFNEKGKEPFKQEETALLHTDKTFDTKLSANKACAQYISTTPAIKSERIKGQQRNMKIKEQQQKTESRTMHKGLVTDLQNVSTVTKLLIRKVPDLEERLTPACKEVMMDLFLSLKEANV